MCGLSEFKIWTKIYDTNNKSHNKSKTQNILLNRKKTVNHYKTCGIFLIFLKKCKISRVAIICLQEGKKHAREKIIIQILQSAIYF
jgi:hypothetical protein